MRAEVDAHGGPHGSARADHEARIDQETLVRLVHLIDDVLDELELQQSARDADAGWVAACWSRRVTERMGVELPLPFDVPPESSNVHLELLAWQSTIIERLCQ
jgi:hypothetical protein